MYIYTCNFLLQYCREQFPDLSFNSADPNTYSASNISDIDSPSKPPASPEAPPFSPITPQNVVTSDDSIDMSHSTVIQDSNSGTLCVPLATSSPLCFSSPTSGEWAGYKLVMDNIDMNLRPRHQTFERQTQSIHYVNIYAVRDRIDFSRYSDVVPNYDSSSLPACILPSEEDHVAIMNNFAILAGRILQQVIPALQDMPHLTTDHIKHAYYKEMSSKSKIVSVAKFNFGVQQINSLYNIHTYTLRYHSAY